MAPLPVPNIFRLGSKTRSRRAAVEEYDDVTTAPTASFAGNAVEIMSPSSSSCYSDEAPTPVIGPGLGQNSQLYETFSSSGTTESTNDEPLPIRAPEHYGDHMHLPDEMEAQRGFDDAPRAIPVEVLDSTTSSDSRRRVTFIGHLSDSIDDRQTNTSSSSSVPRNVRGILKSPRQAMAQRLYDEQVPAVIRTGGSDYDSSTSSSVSTRRAMGRLLNKENIMPRDYNRMPPRPPPPPPQDMYFVIPGNSPVIFQDGEGKEIYRVEAVKTSRKHRRRKYIFQDEDGNELCRIGEFGEEDSSYTGSVTGSNASSTSTSSYRSMSAKMVYLGSDGSVTTEDSSSTFSDVSSTSDRRYDDSYRRDDRDRYRRDDGGFRRGDSYKGGRDDGYRRDNSYRRDDSYRRQSPELHIVDEEGRLIDEGNHARRGRSQRRDDDYEGYDERDYV